MSPNINIKLLTAILLSISFSTHAVSEFDKWKLQQQQGIQQEKKEFQEYKDKRDKEFTSFLKSQWKEIDLLKGVKRDEKPKPVSMPVAKPVPIPDVKKVETIPKPPLKPVVIKPLLPAPVVKPTAPPTPPIVAPKGYRAAINFLGSRLDLYYDPKLIKRISGKIDKKVVSDFWSAMSLADYDSLITQINKQSQSMILNDWAYVLLVNDIAKEIYPGAESEQSLFTWFVLSKAGFKARVAYSGNKVYLLVPSQQQMYAIPYFTFDKVRYYAVRFDGKAHTLGQVYTYDGTYPGANKSLDMQLKTQMVTQGRTVKKDLSFEFENKHYSVHVEYDRERIDLMNTYPQLDLKWYFDSTVSPMTSASLQQQLSKYMKGMSEQQAVNFLLRLVQTSLKYKTDEGQFGKENYLFPEETLHYAYSDCEDRSVIFAWLVHSLLGLEVVGLDYPGHVATAVKLSNQIAGDTITYNNNRYYVADPTYINANIGMTMPDYKNNKPGIINYN